MEIREATKEDISEIIQVLKASLGEVDLPLSKEIWNFKHKNNPFGESLVLVGTESDEIIGVRAFMAWNWQMGNEIFKAYRAVDTATHPNHQGKGVFKKLTLKALEVAKNNEFSFIFNTPNDQSRPGYLKMGWEVVGKINVAISPSISSFLRNKKNNISYSILGNSEGVQDLCDKWNAIQAKKDLLFTPKSLDYLEWRYEKNVLQNYEVFKEGNLYLAGYIKLRGNIKELRISESIFLDKLGAVQMKKVIKEWKKKYNASIITFSPNATKITSKAVKGNFGPVLTIKNLNLNADHLSQSKHIQNWNNSIGDLELF